MSVQARGAVPLDTDTVWTGRPSHWLWFNQWCLAVLTIPLVAGIFWALYLVARQRTTIYRITHERLLWQSGVFTRRTEQIELYRVRDIAAEEPFALRPFGLGHVIVYSTDASDPVKRLAAVQHPQAVAETLRSQVEHQRRARGIRTIEMGGT
ncbi:MAG: PH domain-containing protein [Sinobacteraceae bacterium]|nr:PH domain-containing protein [Nevskiaceae bacterium]